MSRNHDDAVTVWVARCGGSMSGVTAYVHKEYAQNWAESNLGDSGEWEQRGTNRYVYERGVDHCIVELVTIDDAAGILIAEQADIV